MKEIYRCKGRLQNPETFIEVEELKTKVKTTHYFKGGHIHKEEWSLEELKEMKDKKLLTKVNKIAWMQKEEGCQTKKKLQKKKK